MSEDLLKALKINDINFVKEYLDICDDHSILTIILNNNNIKLIKYITNNKKLTKEHLDIIINNNNTKFVECLNLSHNNLNDISFLKYFTNIKKLNLSHNNLTNI